jgi:serine phosphatase RsbU (regulator of sigma subunit)
LFVTSVGEEGALAEALERCADDYLTKPVNFRVLEAKLKALARTLELTRKVREQSVKLGVYYDRSEEERRVVRHLMEQMVNAERLADPNLEHWLSSAESLSGDLIACARTPGQTMHVLLADGIGHGITAALNVLPLTQPFYSMTDKGYCIADILQEMNNKVRQVLPVGRFVAVVLFSIDERTRKIEIWNSGMPAVHVLDPYGRVLHVSKSTNLPLGILPNAQMDFAVDVFNYEESGLVLAHSDGLTEAHRSDGEIFGLQRVLSAMRDGGAGRLLHLQAQFESFMGDARHHDDVSMVLGHFSACQTAIPETVVTMPLEDVIEGQELAWQYGLRLGAAELKSFRTVPFLMSFVNGIQSLRPCRAEVYALLQEICAALLEQGVLDLPAGTALNDEDMYRQSLASLKRGWIELQLSWFNDPVRPSALLLRGAWFGENASGRMIDLPLSRARCVDVRQPSGASEILACFVPA